jgi:hypothetical protein
MDYEKLGLFYLGRRVDPETHKTEDIPVLYDSADLVTHGVILGMTGSGKTGLGIDLIEEAAIDGVPVIAIDPKGDLPNLLLTFPGLSASEFAPWVNLDEARAANLAPESFAAAEAEKWKKGLADWGQDEARIERLRAAAEFALYTPGSTVGRSLSIVKSFAAPPPAVASDAELLGERVSTAATSILTLAGIEAEPLRSREHILISTLLGDAWRQNRDLDLPSLIGQVQSPAVTKVGVLDLESFYPAADRFALAMRLNNLLAAPGFSAWMEGDPLDIDRLLFSAQGKPRVSIISIAHLNDHERMFFVSLLLNELVGWMRAQRGTSSLRALVYFDEIFGFLPPVANPPSKGPLLLLLKQARAFGLGLTVATQNPVDLDYKALSNAGTWMIGRLQTDRDKARLLDGLEGVAASTGEGFDRAGLDKQISSLQKRVFLLHNVHEREPLLFQTRWTMSYLRGPLGREELKKLSPGALGAEGASGAERASEAARVTQAPASPKRPAGREGGPQAPLLDPAIPQYFAPGTGSTWVPVILGSARIAYADAKLGVDESRDVIVTTPLTGLPVPVDWEHAEPADFTIADLERAPDASEMTFADLPAAASKAKSYTQWSKEFERWAGRAQTIELYRHARAKLVSNPDESERDFRIRVQHALREARDAAVSKVRDKYASKIATLDDRLRRAEQTTEKQTQQASDSKWQVGISMATTVFGALLGRKAVSASTLGRATTAARGMGRASREADDVTRAKANQEALAEQRDALAADIERDVAAVTAEWDRSVDEVETVLAKPKRGGVSVQLVALVWLPQ